MNRRSRNVIAPALILIPFILLPGCGKKAGDEPAAEPKGTATPEELFEKLQAAELAGDWRALTLMGGPHGPLINKKVEMFKAAEAFDQALDDKFGKDPNTQLKLLSGPPLSKATKVELKGKKELGADKVELTIWTTRVRKVPVPSRGKLEDKEVTDEERMVAVRENGRWVILAPAPGTTREVRTEKRTGADGKEVEVSVSARVNEPTEQELAQKRELFPKARDALEKGAEDVRAGKYATRKDATEAVKKTLAGLSP